SKSLKVGSVKQYKGNDMKPVIDMNHISINDLNTDAFIIQQRLKAGSVTCDGGLITIYKNQKAGKSGKGSKEIYLSSDIIDQVQVNAINLGNTKIVIIDNTDPDSK